MAKKKVYLVSREVTTYEEVYVLASNHSEAEEMASSLGYGKEEVLNEDSNVSEVLNPRDTLYIQTSSGLKTYAQIKNTK